MGHFLLSLLLVCVVVCSAEIFTKQFGGGSVNDHSYVAVRLAEGVDPEILARLAGLLNQGQVGQLKGYHVFSMERRHGDKDSAISKLRKFLDSKAHSDFAHKDIVLWMEEQVPHNREKRYTTPTDPLYSQQWHLQPTSTVHISAQGAWSRDILGTNIVIGDVDDGLQWSHPDFTGNYRSDLSWDFCGNDADPTPATSESHGTCVGGTAAAANNTMCGVGVAFRAYLAGLRLIYGTVTDSMEASALSYKPQDISVYSSSWGPTDSGQSLEGPGTLTQLAMADTITNGRSGLGCIYIWAAGNGQANKDNCNYDGYTNSRYTISVPAVDATGAQAYYSEKCAANMVAAPSSGRGGIVTTDLLGSYGSSSTDCSSSFGGTSAAAPIIAGVAALVLQANPRLTWRDMQHIFAHTSIMVNPADTDWVINGGGFHHSHKFGFGLVNATAAVNRALTWTNVGPQLTWKSGSVMVSQAVPDNTTTGIKSVVRVPANFSVEWAEVYFNFNGGRRGDLIISLISPFGTSSTLSELHNDNNNKISWTYTSCRNWGEPSLGAWTLSVVDAVASNIGTLVYWQLSLYGFA
ncbi:S8 family serine peptidase [Pelomyxa schiedti]|nr:S8 family serine peptidase [Pelomyxa schiedti]